MLFIRLLRPSSNSTTHTTNTWKIHKSLSLQDMNNNNNTNEAFIKKVDNRNFVQ